MALATNDMRQEKIDVSVGVYRNETGLTPVMAAVRDCEQSMAVNQITKVYEGQKGNVEFCAAIEQLCLGEDLRAARAPYITSYATPGGCGAIWAGIKVAKRANPSARVWISDPSWVNHHHIAASAGFEVLQYRYWDHKTQSLDFDGLLTSLNSAKAGDIIILQGPCHNPTGVDFTPDQWVVLCDMFKERALIAFLDIAYHGFGGDLDSDLIGVRRFLSNQSEFLLSYSCSKNFGLYRERTGCLIAAGVDAPARERLSLHIADVTRAGYSMPPAHGAAIVTMILRSDELRARWTSELNAMRLQIEKVRRDFYTVLSEITKSSATGSDVTGAEVTGSNLNGSKAAGDDRFCFLTQQKGMFSLLPLLEGASERLRLDDAIYIPSSGRINFAALNTENIRPLATGLASELAD